MVNHATKDEMQLHHIRFNHAMKNEMADYGLYLASGCTRMEREEKRAVWC